MLTIPALPLDRVRAASRLPATFLTLALAMAISWIAVPAQAISISIGGPGSSCVTCQGASYALSYSGIALPDADPLHETFRITLTIDTSTLALPGAVAVDAAAIKVSSSVFSSAIFDAPGGAASWNLVPGGIGAGGCSGSGSGFDCADWTAAGVGTAVGGTLSFVFDQTLNNGALFAGLEGSSIKVRYVNADGNKIGALVSESLSSSPPVPEPTAALVFAVGVAVIGSRARRVR
jgi:hypothetical protein